MTDEEERAARLLDAGTALFRHWILEIHLTDTERQFGGFYEQLLDLC
jgi:hypothetical protein